MEEQKEDHLRMKERVDFIMKFSIFKKVGKEKNAKPEELSLENIPKHIAIIMDGNGRWANKRALPRFAGHHEGMKNVKKISIAASKLGVKVLTLYAFSTENWKRPKSEVDFLMKLPHEFLSSFLPELMENDVKVQVMGNLEALPIETRDAVKKAMIETKDNKGLILNFALNYGSKVEIIEAVKQIASSVKMGNLEVENITEEVFAEHLMSSDLIDPDLLIRTSGEQRISNFMLWQIAYSEMYFTDVFWPDFHELNFYEAIEEYQKRQRRYGGI